MIGRSILRVVRPFGLLGQDLFLGRDADASLDGRKTYDLLRFRDNDLRRLLSFPFRGASARTGGGDRGFGCDCSNGFFALWPFAGINLGV